MKRNSTIDGSNGWPEPLGFGLFAPITPREAPYWAWGYLVWTSTWTGTTWGVSLIGTLLSSRGPVSFGATSKASWIGLDLASAWIVKDLVFLDWPDTDRTTFLFLEALVTPWVGVVISLFPLPPINNWTMLLLSLLILRLPWLYKFPSWKMVEFQLSNCLNKIKAVNCLG